MSRKRIYYVIFFAALLVGFFLVMSALIPGYNKKRIRPIAYVKPFSFINQDGEKVDESIMKDKVVAVNFFFTTCRGVCPKMNNNMRTAYDAYKTEKDFLLLSFTCDPERDSVASLKKYADSMTVDVKKWVFLTGRKDSLYRTARQSFKLDDPNNNLRDIKDDFLHTQFIALVNRKGAVVKIYDGLKPSEMAEMKTDVRKLLKE
jgi:protein SCO1/2